MTVAFNAALAAHEAGLCVVPPREDGTKMPEGAWKWYQSQRPTLAGLRSWYENGRSGVGVVCGEISGNLEMLEFEGRACYDGTFNEFRAAAASSGLEDLVNRIAFGYLEQTPSGGIHFLYRCEEISGNLKLARRPATTEELQESPKDRIKVLIETRGEGGYVVVAPSSGGVHPSGEPWQQIEGGFGSIVTITREERAALHELARTFDLMPVPAPIEERVIAPSVEMDGTRPGDDFASKTTWAEILEPHGWVLSSKMGDEGFWRRPGKTQRDTHSATTNYQGCGGLYVFTSSTEFEQHATYSKFAAWAVLNHGGDFSYAGKELCAQGFGDRKATSVIVGGIEPGPEPDPVLHGWPTMDREAFHGLTGEVVAFLSPHTEGDPVGLLVDWLVSFGNIVGPSPHLFIGGRHPATLFAIMVGKSSKARKGSAHSMMKHLLRDVDTTWTQDRHCGAPSSGEGLIYPVRDPINGPPGKDGNRAVLDEGVTDKRLLVYDSEFAGRTLTFAKREGNTLSATIRDAWDGATLQVVTKNNPYKATQPHISIIGHATWDELAGRMASVDVYNGFANRFLFVAVKRNGALPFGSELPHDEHQAILSRIRKAVSTARTKTVVRYAEEAQNAWAEIYLQMLGDDPEGALGGIVARDTIQVQRLSMMYALIDGKSLIEEVHMNAALAVWRYCRRSAEMLLATTPEGQHTGNSDGDALLGLLVKTGAAMDSKKIHEALGWNGSRIASARALLERLRLVNISTEKPDGRGRPRTVVQAK